MKLIRKVTIWAVLAAIGLLVVLSAVGAFVNVEGARRLFNSVPLAVFWFALAGLFILGFVSFKRLIRSPGLLALHLGSLLILAGAMCGSDSGHALVAKFFNNEKIPSGYMQIYERQSTNTVIDDKEKEVGELPFTIGLKEFWIERYEEDRPWLLGIDAPPADGGHDHRQEVIDWVVGEEVRIPFVDIRLKVLRYIERARPSYIEGAVPQLEVIDAAGKKTTLQAEVGQSLDVHKPKGTLRIVQVFSHLTVRAGKAVDVPGSNANPAVRIEFERPDGAKSYHYAYSRQFKAHGRGPDGLDLSYLLPQPAGAQSDPYSNLPAMEVLLSYKDKRLQKWLIPKGSEPRVELSLAALLGSQAPKEGHGGHRHCVASLIMAKREGPISDYKSSLVVFRDDQMVAEKVIQVNDPLHYGGYHFYQHAYGNRRGEYTLLSVKSDLGLLPVYIGFALLCVGAFWLFWVQPAWAYLKKQRSHGN